LRPAQNAHFWPAPPAAIKRLSTLFQRCWMSYGPTSAVAQI